MPDDPSARPSDRPPDRTGADHVLAPALFAAGPHPAHADALALYGQFVGVWDVDNSYLDGDTWHRVSGEWRFGWILRGRAIQDVLTCPAGSDGEPSDATTGAGTTIRVYDPRQDAWQVSWFGTLSGSFCHLVGRPDGDRITQEGRAVGDSRPLRWTFSDIEPDSFRWQGFISEDGGTTWHREQEITARRRGI